MTSGVSVCFGGVTACFVTLLLLLSPLARECCGQQLTEIGDPTRPTIYARSGDVVTLPCNQTAPSPSPVLPFVPFFLQWYRLDLPYALYIGFSTSPPYVDPQYAGRVTIGENLSLQIDGTVAEDDGWYECQVIVLNGNYKDIGNGTFVHLVIIGPPRFLSTPPPLVVFHDGEPDRLQCIAKGTPTPTVTWQKDGRPLTGDHIRTTVNSIEFEGVRQDDGGTYVCKAESEEGAVQHTIRLLVHGAPFIFIPPHNLTVIRGEAAILECEAEASPDNVTQRWYYHGDTIAESEGRYEFLPEGGLVVRQVRREDEGWYSCSPTNGLGEAPIARGYLDVQYPAFVVSMPASAFISRGLDVTMSCPVDADPPLVNVEWYREGSLIIVRRSNRYTISDEGNLTIAIAELEDSGSYTCIPYNKIGTAGVSPATVLIVRDPPAFVIRPKSLYQRLLGEDVIIPCTATGDPLPTVSWKKMNGELPQFRSSLTQNSLTIRGLAKEDHGIYECLAANEIAAVVSTTQLIVELTSPHEPYDVTVATTISSARVAWRPAYNGGFTQTYTVWYRETGRTDEDWSKFDEIPEEVNFYVVHGLQPGTEYQFAVVASNQMGDSLFSDTVSAITKDAGDLVSPTDETGRTLIPIYIGLTPSPPQNLTLVPTQEGLLLAWYPPALWGQFVNRYSIEYRLQGPWVVLYDRVDGSESDKILAKLQPNMTYQFRMFAFTPALFSSPSAVVTGYTGGIPAYLPPDPTTDRTPHYGEPGILAGVLAGISFLLVALLLSILVICISYRKKKKKKKRLTFFSVAAQTPQPLIHRPPQTQSPETPMPAPVKPTGLVSKIIVKISPKHKSDPASAPQPCRQAHLTSNGKLPNSRSEPSLSERLLGRSPHRSSGRYKEECSHRRAGSGGALPRRLASEQALELEEFGPSSAAGVYSVRDGRIRTHGRYNYNSSYPPNNGEHPETGFTDRDDDDSDAPAPDTHSNNIPQVLRPLDSDNSFPVRGDYVYYHGNMFITSNSDDNEDYGWAGDAVANYDNEDDVDEDDRGVVNPALVIDDSVPPTRRTPRAQNQYVDMPTKNTWRWDSDWADDTLSHTRRDIPHSENSVNKHYMTLPRQSMRKDIRHLSRDNFRSGPPPGYHSSPPWSDSISTVQGNSLSARHPDYTTPEYGEPDRTKMNRGQGNYEYGEQHASRRASPQRNSQSPDYERLRNSLRGKESPKKLQKDLKYGEPRASRSPVRQCSPDYRGSHKVYGEPCASKRPSSPYRQKSNYSTYDRTKLPRNKEDLYDYNAGTRDRKSPSKAGNGSESEQYRTPVQQVMKGSPVRSNQGSQGWTDPRPGRSDTTSAESYADTDTLQGTFRDTDRTITSYLDDGREVGSGTVSPTEVARPRMGVPVSPDLASLVRGSQPKINERVPPQGGSRLKINEDIESTLCPKHSSLSPSHDHLQSPLCDGRDKNYNTLPRHPTEGSVDASLSPMSVNSRVSVSSVDSRPGSTKPIPLPQSYISAHQRSLLSPNSQYSASSGYASRNTSQSTASRGRTSSVPSIHDPTLSATTADGVDSPFSDSAGPFSNVSSKESEEPYFEFDPMLHETDLLDALKKYYQPVEIQVPQDEAYEEGTGKVADMEKRCEELKKEFKEYQQRQARAKRRRSRITSSV